VQLGSKRPAHNIQSVILTGGLSRRLGTPKENLKVQGESLLQRSTRVLTEALGVVPLVVGTPECPDIRHEQGPLAGIETAFVRTKSENLFILACDMPAVSVELIQLIGLSPSTAEVVLPENGKQRHPLCARWHRKCLPAIQNALDQNRRSVLQLVDTLDTLSISEVKMRDCRVDPNRELWNVNTMDDWSKYLREATG